MALGFDITMACKRCALIAAWGRERKSASDADERMKEISGSRSAPTTLFLEEHVEQQLLVRPLGTVRRLVQVFIAGRDEEGMEFLPCPLGLTVHDLTVHPSSVVVEG